MKVCHIINDFANGGVEAILYNYFSHMDRSKYEISIVSYAKSDIKCYNKFKQLGVYIYVVPPKKEFYRSCSEVLRIFKNGKFDIVHSHMTEFICVLLVLAYLARIRVRISHSHLVNNQFKSAVAKVLDFIKCKGGALFATDYWACGELAAIRLFGEKAYRNNRVHIMYNAVDCDLFRYDQTLRKQTRSKLGIGDKFCIGHVARFDTQKNNEFTVQLFHRVYSNHKNVILLWLGEGKDRKKIEDMIKEKGIEENVYLLGTRDDIHRFYQAMDVFILPSLYEGLPVAAIEAQISGLNAILSNTITTEVLLTELALMLPIDDAGIWADTILRYIDSKDTIKRKSHIIDAYDIRKQVKVLEKCYDEMCSVGHQKDN